MKRPVRLLVDVSQYVSWPATSGIQRVLGCLARAWPEGAVKASYGYIDHGRFVTGEIRTLGSMIEATFQRSRMAGGPAEIWSPEICGVLESEAESSVDVSAVSTQFDAYLLPEPTLQSASLRLANDLLRSAPTSTYFLYFDALPLTRPGVYPLRADSALNVTRYHLTLARADNIAFISDATRREFERRVARRALPNPAVVRPGADALPPRRNPQPAAATFVIVGTVEPRKGHRIVLDAFEHLWSAGGDYRLIVLGAPGWERDDMFDRLRRHAYSGRVEWSLRPHDEALSSALSRASALIFVSEFEGYGLPPLEALFAGCPVIVSERLPALEGVPSGGQIRLASVTVETIREAVEVLADPATNIRYREAIDAVPLPTWSRFAEGVERWVLSGLRRRDRAAA